MFQRIFGNLRNLGENKFWQRGNMRDIFQTLEFLKGWGAQFYRINVTTPTLVFLVVGGVDYKIHFFHLFLAFSKPNKRNYLEMLSRCLIHNWS